MLAAAAVLKQPARNSEQQVTVLRRVLKLTVKAAEAMSKGAVNFLGGNARSVPAHALANGAIVPACATRSSLSFSAAGHRASDKTVSPPTRQLHDLRSLQCSGINAGPAIRQSRPPMFGPSILIPDMIQVLWLGKQLSSAGQKGPSLLLCISAPHVLSRNMRTCAQNS